MRVLTICRVFSDPVTINKCILGFSSGGGKHLNAKIQGRGLWCKCKSIARGQDNPKESQSTSTPSYRWTKSLILPVYWLKNHFEQPVMCSRFSISTMEAPWQVCPRRKREYPFAAVKLAVQLLQIQEVHPVSHSSACNFCCFYLFFLPVLSRSSFTSRTPNKDQKTEQLFYFLLIQVL